MGTYRAKTSYCSNDVVSAYDKIRFTSAPGKLLDRIEKSSFLHLLRVVDRSRPVLDLACGSGRFLMLELDRGFDTVGADISLSMLELAQEKVRDRKSRLLGLVLCDAEALPFRQGCLGCISVMRFLPLLPHYVKRKIMNELYLTTARFVIAEFGNLLSLRAFVVAARSLRKRAVESYDSPWKMRREIGSAGFLVSQLVRPLVVPPSRFPDILLGFLERLNDSLNTTFLRFFSVKYFLLLEKKQTGAHWPR